MILIVYLTAIVVVLKIFYNIFTHLNNDTARDTDFNWNFVLV